MLLLLAPVGFAAEEGAPASEAGSGQEGAKRWVPSLAFVSGILVQKWNGDAASLLCRGCTLPDPAQESLRDPESGDDLAFTPFVGGNFELMTPEIDLPLSPRVFFGGEIMGLFGFERPLASDGNPGRLRSPLPAGSNTFYGENAALGQGTEVVAEIGNVAYGLHGGVAFPFELFDRPLRAKVSFGWMRYEVDVRGLVVDAECLPAGSATRCNTTNSGVGFQREARLVATDADTYDGIGPGFDIEMDTGRFGSIGSSLFLGGRAYYILGDRDLRFGDAESFDDALGMDDSAATFRYQMEEWVFRLAVGVRFQWLGPERF